jgi:signal transduction histidine kinase
MRGWSGVRGWLRAHPRIADGALAAVIFVAGVSARPGDEHRLAVVLNARDVLLLAAACAALIFRRTYPVAVWGLTLAVGVLSVVVAHGPTPAIVPSLVALYTLATRLSLPWTAASALATAGPYLLSSVTAARQLTGITYAVVGWSGMVAAIGAAVKNQRAIVAAAEDRAVRAEQTREEEAQRRVAEERLRIARELHDVVAHHISVINVQSGVVRHLLESDPEQARTAITLVREASRTALTELSAILGLLRTNENGEATQPAPSLGQAEELLTSMRQAGLRAVWRLTGQPVPLPPLIDLTAYRIVQESLTNAAKHGNGDADVAIEYEPALVRIVVSNSLREGAPAPAGAGHGVIGMRERVSSVGGRLTLGPAPAGRFMVTAELPLELS